MSHSLTWAVEVRDGLIIVTVTGTVDTRSGPALCHALMQCLEREPGAVVVDVSGASVTDPGIFSTVVDEAQAWPGTPLLFCTPDADTAGLVTAPVHPTMAGALSALTGRNELISEVILPVSGAARRARTVVTEACLRWDAPDLVAPATLVVSELVSNAVMHARTMMTLQVALRPRYVYLAVIDGSPTAPAPRSERPPDASGGRGLHLVAMAADRWGCRHRHDGKAVWARFRVG